MKISLITVSLNSEKSILDTINSVKSQTYQNIEHIFIDGNSSDLTIKIIKKNMKDGTKILSEDDNGIYEAINKGIRLCSGNVIGIVNSDDILFSKYTIRLIANEFKNKKIDIIYGDSVFYKDNQFEKPTRYYDSSIFRFNKLKYGIMPAHTTLFCKKDIFKKNGLYDISFEIAADFDFFCRLSKIKNIKINYINHPLVRMREGGKSTGSLHKKLKITHEILEVLKKNKINSNYLIVSLRFLLKLRQVFFVSNKLKNKLMKLN